MRPFIYALVDRLEPGHIRYVGMATVKASRPYVHAYNARNNPDKLTHLFNWIRKLQARNCEPTVMELEEFPEGTAKRLVGHAEKSYISVLKELGHRLTNVTVGGFGGNAIQTVEARKAQSKRMIELWQSPEYRVRHAKGVADSDSPEHRARLSAGMKRALAKPEAQGQRASSAKVMWEKKKASPDYVPNVFLAGATQEAKDAAAEAARKACQTPEYKARHSEILKSILGTPEARARKSEIGKAIFGTPEARARRSQISKDAHTRRRAADALLSPELRAQKEIMRLQKYIAKLKAQEKEETA